MIARTNCDTHRVLQRQGFLKVVIFGAAAVRELGQLERKLSKSWPRFEALTQRLADYGQIHSETAFKHEFDGITQIDV